MVAGGGRTELELGIGRTPVEKVEMQIKLKILQEDITWNMLYNHIKMEVTQIIIQIAHGMEKRVKTVVK